MRLAEPQYLWLLALLPALAAFWLYAGFRRRRRRASFADAPTFARIASCVAPGRRRLGALAPLAAFLFLAAALARPQFGMRRVQVERLGAAWALVIDASLSMATEDEAPSRFLFARKAIARLLETLGGDRVALVAFAADAHLLSPLTSDYAALLLTLDGLSPGTVGRPGSSLAAGVRRGLEALSGAPAEMGRALVVLSDGEDWGGNLEAAAREAKSQGVALFVLGTGATKGEPIPIRGPDNQVQAYKMDAGGEVVISKLEEEPLRKLASEGGGRYWHLSASFAELSNVISEIERLSRRVYEEKALSRYEDFFQWLLAPALFLLWLEILWPWTAVGREGRGAAGARTSGGPWPVALAALLLWISSSAFDWRTYRSTQEGVRAYGKEDFAAAAKSFEGALQGAPAGAPEAARLHYNLGAAYYKEGRFDDAMAEWDRAAKAFKDPRFSGAARYNLGNAALSKALAGAKASQPDAESMKRALREYQKALELNPGDQAARHNFEVATRLLEAPPPQPRQGGEDKDQKEQAQKKEQAGQDKQDKKDGEDKNQDEAAATGEAGRKESEKDAEAEAAAAAQAPSGPPEGKISKSEAERLLDSLEAKDREERKRRHSQLQWARGQHDW